MSTVTRAKDRLVHRAGKDVSTLLHELKLLKDDLIMARDHADRMGVVTSRINDTLATLETFTSNREEISKLDHATLSEMLCMVEPDVLVAALDKMRAGCRRKIREALAEFQDT